jgi:hypothetical protein
VVPTDRGEWCDRPSIAVAKDFKFCIVRNKIAINLKIFVEINES